MIQDYVHRDDQTQAAFEMTPGFKPFTVLLHLSKIALPKDFPSRALNSRLGTQDTLTSGTILVLTDKVVYFSTYDSVC